MTARDLITFGLRELNVYGHGETPSAEDLNDGLTLLNDMVDSWRLDRLWLHEVSRITKTLTVAVDNYTIGTGASISTERPDFRPEAAAVIMDPAAVPLRETPIDVFTDDQWRRVPDKNLTSSYVRGIYYDFAFNATTGFGKVLVWPVPTVVHTLVLYLPAQQVAQFADLSTDYLMPPGYKLALRRNFLIEVAPGHERPISQQLKDLAQDAYDRVASTNIRPGLQRADEATAMTMGSRRSGFDIRTGGYR